jgi:monoterpene epsilon-lactone hydrolase
MSDDIKNVRKILTAMPDTTGIPVEEKRRQMDQMAAAGHLPRDCSVEPVNAGGVPAEWINPKGASKDKAIFYLHGGGYVMGSLTSHRQLVAYIARASGATALSIDYRLAPEHPFPAAVEDAVAGYRWLLRQGFSPKRIIIAGDSAGGGLTIATLVSLRDLGDPLPAAGICLCPWVDLTCSSETYRTKADTDPIVRQKEIQEIAALYLGGQDPKTPLASPLFADLTGLPPLLIQVGSEEVLQEDSIGLDKKARACGVDSRLEVWEEMIHVWHSFSPILKEGREAITRIGEYFKQIIPT